MDPANVNAQAKPGGNGAEVATEMRRMFDQLLQKERVERAPVPVVNGQLVPADLDGLVRLARYAHTSGLGPLIGTGQNKRAMTLEEYVIVIAAGQAAGMNWIQSLTWIMIVNNRPSIWGDAVPGLILASPKCERFHSEWEGLAPDGSVTDDTVAVCRAKRKGSDDTRNVRYSVKDAKAAGLWRKPGPWSEHPKRMLGIRARSFAARDVFADVLMGLSIVEEVQDYAPDTAPATLRAASLQARLDAMPDPSAPQPKPASAPTPEPAAPPDAEPGPITDADLDAALGGKATAPTPEPAGKPKRQSAKSADERAAAAEAQLGL